MNDQARNEAFVRLLIRPRPDHPNEKKWVVIRCSTICVVTVDEWKYHPSDNAPVALLPNSKTLTGEATVVVLITGQQFVVDGTLDEVLNKIKLAYEGASPMLPMGVRQQ